MAATLGVDNPYFATSPTGDTATGSIAMNMTGSGELGAGASPLGMSSNRSVNSDSTSGASPRPYVSKVGILPSSLPAYHKDYIAGNANTMATPSFVEPPAAARTLADQEETSRRLRPQSRSQIRLDESNKRPQGMTPVNLPKKSKQVRWQFGIRSRNVAWDALLCIYKALNRLGCSWVVDEDFNKYSNEEDDR